MKALAVLLISVLSGVLGFAPTTGTVDTVSGLASAHALAPTRSGDLIPITKDWDVEAALLSQSQPELLEQAPADLPRHPNGVIKRTCMGASTSYCTPRATVPDTTITDAQPVMHQASLRVLPDEDQDELQGPGAYPKCPEGARFIPDGRSGPGIMVQITGSCQSLKTSQPVPPLSQLGLFDEVADDDAAPEREEVVMVVSEAPEFHIPDHCVATIEHTEDTGTVTTKHCPELASDSAIISPASEVVPSDEPPVYVIAVHADEPVELSTCLLTHSTEVTGESTQCTEGSGDSAAASSATPGASALPAMIPPLLTRAFPANLVPEGFASGTNSAGTPLAATAHVVINGGWMGERQVGADGLAQLTLAALPTGVHHVELVFDPDHEGASATSIVLLVDAQDGSGTPSETLTNSQTMFLVLGSLFGLSVLVMLWLLVGERLRRTR